MIQPGNRVLAQQNESFNYSGRYWIEIINEQDSGTKDTRFDINISFRMKETYVSVHR